MAGSRKTMNTPRNDIPRNQRNTSGVDQQCAALTVRWLVSRQVTNAINLKWGQVQLAGSAEIALHLRHDHSPTVLTEGNVLLQDARNHTGHELVARPQYRLQLTVDLGLSSSKDSAQLIGLARGVLQLCAHAIKAVVEGIRLVQQLKSLGFQIALTALERGDLVLKCLQLARTCVSTAIKLALFPFDLVLDRAEVIFNALLCTLQYVKFGGDLVICRLQDGQLLNQARELLSLWYAIEIVLELVSLQIERLKVKDWVSHEQMLASRRQPQLCLKVQQLLALQSSEVQQW